MNQDEVDAVVSPLKSLHELRTKLKGHASGAEAKMLLEEILAKHGSLKSHYQALVGDCDRSVALLIEFAGKGIF